MESTTGFVSEENNDGPGRDLSELIDELEIVYGNLSREPVEVDAFLSEEVQLKKLLKFGWRLTRDSDTAQDLAHEAIVKSLPILRDGLRPPGVILNFLKTAMLHTHHEQLRKKKRARDHGDYGDGLTVSRADGEDELIDVRDDSRGLPTGVSSQEANVLRDDIETRIVRAMRRLPLDQLHVVALALGLHKDHPYRSFTQTEIAEFLGISLDLVKSRWRQGRAPIRASLEDFWDDWKRS